MQQAKKIWGEISKLQDTPEPGTEQHRRWLKHEDIVSYLLGTSVGFAPIYISGNGFFEYSIFVPEAAFAGDYVNDLLSWNFMISGGWGYGYHYEDGKPQKTIFPPMDHTDSKILDQKVPIIYYRNFYGYPTGHEVYLELDQRIAHILDVHWLEMHHAYCKLDRLGDIKPVIETASTEQGLLALADLQELDFYMYLTDTAIVRVFDVMRYKGMPWSNEESRKEFIHIEERNTELHARLVVTQDTQSYLRGFQIIRRISSDERMQKVLKGKDPNPEQYASFIAFDWKHKDIRECSCAPDDLASYFVESDLPFGVSPAFFRPEVLLKYKQDPGKYSLEHRQISCRGTWSLPYDTNEQGQVHAYLCDLQNLPFDEQIYWRSFNESPKTGISKRAYKTDFLAEWDTEYDPLYSLKNTLGNFPTSMQYGLEQPVWRVPEGANPYSKLSYVVTTSSKEWEDQILELSRIIIDKLEKGNIRKVAKLLGCDEPQLGSLKLLRLSLLHLGVENDVVDEVMNPLDELWQLRSKGIAHFGNSVPDVDLRDHYASLITELDNSMKLLAEFVSNGLFNISNNGELSG